MQFDIVERRFMATWNEQWKEKLGLLWSCSFSIAEILLNLYLSPWFQVLYCHNQFWNKFEILLFASTESAVHATAHVVEYKYFLLDVISMVTD